MRKGLTEVRNAVQSDGMDEPLRYGLWNAVHVCLWEKNRYTHHSQTFSTSILYPLFQQYWLNFFKKPLDTLPGTFRDARKMIREYFLGCSWYEVYDFIEFTAQNGPKYLVNPEYRNNFVDFCNDVLEKECAAFRFIGSQLTDITSDEELESIGSAIDMTTEYAGARKHLQTALGYLSDRKSPDFRNSVKESISAVESLCKEVSGDSKATLGTVLKTIEKDHKLHKAFTSALSSLYGYTSDSNGIRHAMLEDSTTTYIDAKFMLVACSAFVNYVLGKLAESN